MRRNKAASERTIIFLHIPKTAGTTIQQVIERNCRKGDIYTLGIDGWFDDFKSLPDSRKADIHLLRGGHPGFGLHKYLPSPSTYFTFLRDPIERAISYYYWVQRDPHHYAHDFVTASHMGLRDFIESRQDTLVDNCQTRLLAGLETGYEIGFGQCTTEMLESAKRNLEEYFAVVGLTEEFDATLILLKKAFGWRKLAYVRQNVTPDRLKKSEISQVTLDAIAKVNLLDIELFRYARALFEEQVRRQGASFAQEVRDFQVANRRLHLFVHLYWEARKVSVRTMIRRWIQVHRGSLA
jgi:hypothetical protein